MSVLDFLFNFFDNEEAQTEYASDPQGYLDEHLPEGMTSAEFYDGLEGVCGQLPPEQAAIIRGIYNIDGPSTPPPPNYPPPPPQYPGESEVEYAVRQINYYNDVVNVTNQTYEDNDTTTINDQDTNIDNSVNQEITAFGDVTQDFDNDVVTGDRAVAAGDGSQVNTGDEAVQVGGNLTDSTVATGDVEGSVTGDVYDSVVGNNNQVIDVDGRSGPPVLERTLIAEEPGYGTDIGPVAFGDGDAIQAENLNQGSGAIVDDIRDGDVAVNTGAGNQAVVQNSDVSESSVGGGDVTSNDVDINAYGDSAVAFGEGSSAEVDDVDIQDNSGTVQVAGDDSIQQGITDNDVNLAADVDVDLGGGLTRSPVPVLAEAEAYEEPSYDDAPDDGAPTIDDADTFNQNIDADDLDGLDA